MSFFFFFKPKTAYGVRISGWSSDVCSSDLDWPAFARRLFGPAGNELVELLAYGDADKGRHRFAAFAAGRPLGALYVAPEPVEEIGRAPWREGVCQSV